MKAGIGTVMERHFEIVYQNQQQDNVFALFVLRIAHMEIKLTEKSFIYGVNVYIKR